MRRSQHRALQRRGWAGPSEGRPRRPPARPLRLREIGLGRGVRQDPNGHPARLPRRRIRASLSPGGSAAIPRSRAPGPRPPREPPASIPAIDCGVSRRARRGTPLVPVGGDGGREQGGLTEIPPGQIAEVFGEERLGERLERVDPLETSVASSTASSARRCAFRTTSRRRASSRRAQQPLERRRRPRGRSRPPASRASARGRESDRRAARRTRRAIAGGVLDPRGDRGVRACRSRRGRDS